MSTPPSTMALVTGHTRGLGQAIAAELLGRGIAVLGLARAHDVALAARHPGLSRQQALDLADSAALIRWLQGGALAHWAAGAARVLLVNNAGTVHPMGPPGRQEAQAVAAAVALNVTAPLLLANAVVAATPQATDRRVLHIGSGAGRNAYPGWSVYCATKAALDMHAHASQRDAVPGLRIASVAPGVIDTDMQADIRAAGVDDCPVRARFEALKRDGGLVAPAEAARQLVDLLLSEGFGQAPVGDLREAR